MYLSDSEEIVAFIVAIAIVIGFIASTYIEIKNTIAEEKAKLAEKRKNEEKIGKIPVFSAIFDSVLRLLGVCLARFWACFCSACRMYWRIYRRI